MNEDNIGQQIQIEGLTEKEVKELSDIIKRFVNSYMEKDKSMTDDEWLYEKLKEELPDKGDNEIKKIADEIMTSVLEFDTNLNDINKACNSGVSKEEWFIDKVSDASKGISMIDYGNYLNNIDNTISTANAQMMRTITTNSGEISKCINLDGFIAEQHAVNTFNMDQEMGADLNIASGAIAISTALSFVTLFIWISLFKHLGMF